MSELTSHDAGAVCQCVSDHRPGVLEYEWHHVRPLYLGGEDTKVGVPDRNGCFVCPNAHGSVHEIFRMIFALRGELPWGTALELWPNVGLNRYAFRLAHEGYRRYLADEWGVPTTTVRTR